MYARKKRVSLHPLTVFLAVAFLSGLAYGRVIYVDDDANGVGDGSSWAKAYRYLQDALAEAKAIDKPVEIRIAKGIYRPTTGRFQLTSGVAIKGGYAGLSMPDPNFRDIKLYETIFSGDLEGNDVEVDNPRDLENEPTRQDNSDVFIIYQVDNVLLDGVTITGGRKFTPIDAKGGIGGAGMLIGESSPTIINCTFTGNMAIQGYGGAVDILSGHSIFQNCTFAKNYGSGGGAIRGGLDETQIANCLFMNNAALLGGGAIADCAGLISNCKFQGNSAGRAGGALSGCNGLITKCLFVCNSADQNGGAVDVSYFDSSSFENCIFAGNVASLSGGGLFLYYDSTATLFNCSFSCNSATNGNAIASYIRIPSDPANNAQLKNCILWDGGTEIWQNDNAIISVRYSTVWGGYDGIGNIDKGPLFADPYKGDFHLKSQSGRWDPVRETCVVDYVTSPCIDAGDPNSPVGLEPSPNGGRINMGAYGGTAEASKSYLGSPCITLIAGDINNDCRVDFLDLAILTSNWLEKGPYIWPDDACPDRDHDVEPPTIPGGPR